MGVRVSSLKLGLLAAIAAACSSDHAVTPPVASCGSSVGTPISLAVGQYLAVDPATDSGCVRFSANASVESTEYLVVPQSAAPTSGQSSAFRLVGGAAAANLAALTVLTPPSGSSPTVIHFDQHMRWMGRNHSYPVVPAALRAAAARAAAGPPTVGTVRVFKVCGNLSCTTIKNVAAKARVVGAHIAVFVDTLAPTAGLDSADLDSLKQVFDTRLYPLDTATFGAVSDIDSNSVVIVLMTGVVNSLVSKAQCNANGYVAGFFFAGDLDPLAASQFNNGEIFYSIVADPAGTLSCSHSVALVKAQAPVTFVHEFQHMISFVQHVLVRSGASEEGWLDEGLSKYAEELVGRSFLPGNQQQFTNFVINDLFDAYDYLSSPGGSPLLIPQDTGTLAEVGASWLFTRYIVDQSGASLAGKLDQTTLVGSNNVATQTGVPFTTLVTRWALANWVSDLSVQGFTAPSELQYTSWSFRTTYASLHAQDSTDFARLFPLLPVASAGSGVNVSGTLTSGSGSYVRAIQPGSAGFSVQVTKNGSTALPASLVPRLNILRIR
jgi:hypothetical protein